MYGAYVLECTIGNGFPVARNCLIRSVDTVPSTNMKIRRFAKRNPKQGQRWVVSQQTYQMARHLKTRLS